MIIAADKGSNELAAERYLSQPIKDSYGRDISHSYVIHELRDFDLRGSLLRINSIVEGEKQPELIVIIEGIDQDLLHFETSFNEGRIRMVDNDDESRQQLRFIVTNNGTDTDDHLQPSDAYTLPFNKSLLGEWLSTEFEELPERFGILTGGDGNDTLFGSTRLAPVPVVYLDGGTGNDVIYGSDVNSYTDRLLGQEGNDKLHGLRGENILSGGPGEDELYGGFNNDTLEGGPGADWLEAGAGFDTASYSEDKSGVVVNLSWNESPIVVLPAEGGDATLINPELTLNELSGDLREIAEDLVSSGYLRLDPTTNVRNFVETIFGDNGKIPVPEIFDRTASNPLLLTPERSHHYINVVPAASTNYELSDGQNKIKIKTGEDYVIPVETKPSTTYTLSDGKQSISASTSDHTDLDELVTRLQEQSDYKNLEFTIYADNDSNTIKLSYEEGIEPINLATLKASNNDVITAEDATTHDKDICWT